MTIITLAGIHKVSIDVREEGKSGQTHISNVFVVQFKCRSLNVLKGGGRSNIRVDVLYECSLFFSEQLKVLYEMLYEKDTIQ